MIPREAPIGILYTSVRSIFAPTKIRTTERPTFRSVTSTATSARRSGVANRFPLRTIVNLSSANSWVTGNSFWNPRTIGLRSGWIS